jgi:transcriptional regulator with XRE-family HTH domain
MDYRNIGKKIMLARKEAGLLQRQLGEKLDLDQATISCYESGSLAIEMETISKISQILNKPISFFYGDEYSRASDVVSLDEVKIPIFTEIPQEFPLYSHDQVKGFQRHPKHMYPGVDFILKNPANLEQEPDDSGNYYYLKIEREPQNGKCMLFRMPVSPGAEKLGYFLQRISVKDGKIDVHSIKREEHLIDQKNLDFIAVLVQILNDVN